MEYAQFGLMKLRFNWCQRLSSKKMESGWLQREALQDILLTFSKDDGISISWKKKLMYSLVWSVSQYGNESWTLELEKREHALEMTQNAQDKLDTDKG